MPAMVFGCSSKFRTNAPSFDHNRSVLTLAGFQQGFSWQEGIPEVNVLPQLHAYYIARGIFGAW